MLIDELKKRMFDAMKRKATVEKEIVRVAIGEITSTGAEATDERVTAVLRKLVKSNEETLKVCAEGETKETLLAELVILREFLPKSLAPAQIVEQLGALRDQLRAAPSEGQAMGLAMKQLKGAGAQVESKDVTEAVRQLRSANG
jgi:uncharacterized protein YqeY